MTSLPPAVPPSPTGHLRDRYGWRVFVKVGRRQKEKRFPAETPFRTRENWRLDTRAGLRAAPPEQDYAERRKVFADDVEHYLTLVQAMPTLAERTRHLEFWTRGFGERSRHTVTAAEIRSILQSLRASGLAAATCNKRRTALMHLWTVLDGKDAKNPVRAVPKFPVEDPLPRGKDPHTIDHALRKAPRCRSRATCRVLLWTGMRPVELQRMEPSDLDWPTRTLIVRTAKGGRTRVVPLTSQGIAALREFHTADTWQRVPQAAPLNRWLKTHTDLEIRVYDLRHSYGTALARRGTRLDVIAALMGHSTLELTRRYTLAAVTPDALAATRKLAGAVRLARSAGNRKTAG